VGFAANCQKFFLAGKQTTNIEGLTAFDPPCPRQQQCIVKCQKGKEISRHQQFIKEYLPQENKNQVVDSSTGL
jgi:hypothetical protein